MGQREKLANQYININRRRYAVGLLWQPIGAGFVAHSYARTLARSIDKKRNLYVEYRMMIGLGARKLGQKTGMPSAAAEIMDSLTEYNSFLGVFPVGRQYYLIAVRNGIILKDVLFEREIDARSAYFELSEIPDWGALFAPGAWGMPRAIERKLSELIRGSARAVLRPIGWVGAGVISVVLLLIFAAVLFHIFSDPINQVISPQPKVAEINPELAAEYKKQIEEKNKELDVQFETKPEPLVMPYDNLPDRYARADICYKAMGFLMQPVAGWVQTSVECNEDSATVQMQRDFGTLGDFYMIAGGLMPGATVFEQGENALQVRANLPKAETFASQDERDVDSVIRDITTAFQAANAPIESIGAVVDTLTNGVDTKYLNIVEVAAESKLVPAQFMKIFDDFGGVYLTRAAWNAVKRTWNYEVIIYAK